MADVTVHQLRSRNDGEAYLNVNERQGQISVYAHLHECPTYLAQTGRHVWLLVFDSLEWADEHFANNEGKYDTVTRLRDIDQN